MNIKSFFSEKGKMAARIRPKVVCVKVGSIRPNYDNLRDWCEDEDNLYIGRKGIVFVEDDSGNKERFPKKDSKWANPFKLNKSKDNIDEVLDKYDTYVRENFYQEDILELEGKTLGCWCKPGKCHGDILVEIFDQVVGNE